jgi:anion-transporting  ArsA/GET3 family ATPase
MVTFELQPNESDLQGLANELWQGLDDQWKKLEKAAFEAGKKIREGDYSRDNLKAIVQWKSPRTVHHLIDNSDEKIEAALKVAASEQSTVEESFKALRKLKGIGVPVASAILTTIFPDQYTIIDFRALEALGHPQMSVEFYKEYLAHCKSLVGKVGITPQDNAPAPTALRALDRALWRWSEKKDNVSSLRSRKYLLQNS